MRYFTHNPPYKANISCEWVKRWPAVRENQMRLLVSQHGFHYVSEYSSYDEAEREISRLVSQGATLLENG